jgi:hypothetical protein
LPSWPRWKNREKIPIERRCDRESAASGDRIRVGCAGRCVPSATMSGRFRLEPQPSLPISCKVF